MKFEKTIIVTNKDPLPTLNRPRFEKIPGGLLDQLNPPLAKIAVYCAPDPNNPLGNPPELFVCLLAPNSFKLEITPKTACARSINTLKLGYLATLSNGLVTAEVTVERLVINSNPKTQKLELAYLELTVKIETVEKGV